jgi:hypothetical protein
MAAGVVWCGVDGMFEMFWDKRLARDGKRFV